MRMDMTELVQIDHLQQILEFAERFMQQFFIFHNTPQDTPQEKNKRGFLRPLVKYLQHVIILYILSCLTALL